MAVTIKDIAKITGVSPASVSLVLNNKPGVGDETRQRILAIAGEMGYQGPKSQTAVETETVLFLHISRHGHTVNRDHDVFIADYIDGLGQSCKHEKFNLEILTFKTTPIEKIIKQVKERTASGIIVLGTELSETDITCFSEISVPLVFIDTYVDLLPFDFVDMNNQDSIFTLIENCVGKGHRSFGMVTSSIETRNFKLREEGFKASLGRLGLTFEDKWMFAVDPTFHGANLDMQRILKEKPELPSVLVCANDIIACGCLRAFHHAGIRVPDDVSVTGFDDLPLSAVVDPPLTTIRVSKAQIGRMAIHLLAMRIRGEAGVPPVKVVIGGCLIERQSLLEII